ncbi:hypothetical protein E4T52_03897 [Aureobasidium sp. EXF-3400]|nr:hypothetical protein E4T51_12955 [Aureobasidium sp. EXF-12344]KAI4781147.1 hypothetical protein E4T52_03897 [Aureobasidium sp. EXF-3400]
MASSEDLPSSDAASKVPIAEPSQCLILPNELLSMIAHECDPADLKNMRLASRLMHQVATVPFARKYFSRRRFIFTYQSLKALVDITAHPTFGPHLTCITFGTYRLAENAEVRFGEYRSRDWSNRYRLAEAMHRGFVNRNHHVEMLVSALENLKKCQNTKVALGIYDDVHDNKLRRRGYAYEAWFQDFSFIEPDPSTALDAVLTASRHSNYPFTALKLFFSTQSGSLENLALGPTSVLDSVLPHTGSESTKAFDLHVNVWQQEGSYAKIKILSRFTRLEVSRHHLGDQELDTSPLIALDKEYQGRIWQTIMSSPLKSISITRSDTEYRELVRMPVFEPPKNLTLEFLRFLKEVLDLTYLSMEDLFVEDVENLGPLIFLSVPDEELVCDGKEEVQEGLERLIEEVKQGYQHEELESSAEIPGGESEVD